MAKEPWLARVIRSNAEKALAGSKHLDEIIALYLEAHPEKRIIPLNIPDFDFKTATPEELRSLAVESCKEADRLEALAAKGPVYVLRETGKWAAGEFLFCDQSEKDVRFWLLEKAGQYKDKGVLLYREWWADDPQTSCKKVTKRELVGNPIKDALEAKS